MPIKGPITEFVPAWLRGDEFRVEPGIKPYDVFPDEGFALFAPELDEASPNIPPEL